MLVLIRDLRKLIPCILSLAVAAMLASCATDKSPRLVDDPDEHHESVLPWNKQEKWETGGAQFANMTDHR